MKVKVEKDSSDREERVVDAKNECKKCTNSV